MNCVSVEVDSCILLGQADDLLREADDLLAQMAKGHMMKKAQVTEDFALDNGERPGFQLQCDVNGCSIVPVSTSDAARGPSGTYPAPAEHLPPTTPLAIKTLQMPTALTYLFL